MRTATAAAHYAAAASLALEAGGDPRGVLLTRGWALLRATGPGRSGCLGRTTHLLSSRVPPSPGVGLWAPVRVRSCRRLAAAVLAECGTAPPSAPPCRTGERAPAAIAGSAHGGQGPRYLRNQGQKSLFHRARSDLQSRVEGEARRVGGVDSSRTATAGDWRSGHGPPPIVQRAIRTSARPPTSLPVARRLAAPRPHPYPCATTLVPPP